MKLASDSQLKLEQFFREYFKNEKLKLPIVYIHAGKFASFLTFVLKVHGITLGRNIFIAPSLITFSENNRLKLHTELAAHEITHVLQFRREGFIKFFFKYFKDYICNLLKKRKWNAVSRQEAYLEITFEIEARKTAANFIEWRENQLKTDN